MRKDIALGLWLAGLPGMVFAASWETTSLRTSSGSLVNTGMTRQEVLRELGELRPASGSGKSKSSLHAARLVYRGRDGVYTLTFSGDRLSRIDVTPNR
ncbi:MAG: hypothetical protein OEV31_00410 [Gammaproteobacteria bacterium]|nr:hypothetical protein [Gammaproteobacteria bacterium]